ncbi:MAG: 4-alpha-glucanotransferase [Gemmatimonadales bacterium]|nr:4-alpha-glucanotransferase [Gemmatimonadales bacterium]
MDELTALRALASELGVALQFRDGLKRPIAPSPETLLAVCRALGAPVTRVGDAFDGLRALQAYRAAEVLPPVLVAWEGRLLPVTPPVSGASEAWLHLAVGGTVPLVRSPRGLEAPGRLPWGYHELVLEHAGRHHVATVISAPVEAWRRPEARQSWGVGTQLAALRSRRSRHVGDLADLRATCAWVGRHGGDLVTVLPLLPTFNHEPPECSPYSPVSRLFWSELILDLGAAHRPAPAPAALDVRLADAEVRAALADVPLPPLEGLDEELVAYARFRGAQARLGRNWRDWPAPARAGQLGDGHVDPEELRFHVVAQLRAREQLHDLRTDLARDGMRVGLDLAVGVHPDGFDPWSRQHLFCDGMSVGAPPDQGFPSGQDWGFTPVLPRASRAEGHRYLAASIAHQASLAGVLRVDHIMALTRLYWIPHGMGLHEGTYVSYPVEELLAVLVLESHRHECEMVGENLGTVPPEIDEALPRHRIRGLYLAEFMAGDGLPVPPPTAAHVALIGSHDTPPLQGWLTGTDIGERVRHRLLAPSQEQAVREERAAAAATLATFLGTTADDGPALLGRLLDWLGRSPSPLVIPWVEDLWLEDEGVNLPGTRSSERPNWQRPMRRLLDDVFADDGISALLARLERARRAAPAPTT